jgi:hypothetical protein
MSNTEPRTKKGHKRKYRLVFAGLSFLFMSEPIEQSLFALPTYLIVYHRLNILVNDK